MRSYFACLPLFLLALPLGAQIRMPRQFPPDMISQDDLVRDVMKLGFAHVTVDLENDHLRTLRFKLAPGEAVPTHDDRAGVLVCLTGCRIRFTAPDGQTQDLELKAGETRWLAAGRRITRNTGSAALEMLYVESKRPQT